MNVQTQIVPDDPPRLPVILAGAAPRALVPQDFEGAWRIANAVFKAGMAPTGIDSAEKAMVAIMHGLEVGMTPMMALQSIAPINGRPAVWGDGALGLCQGSGLLEWHREYYRGTRGADDYTAVCEVKRRGDPEVKIGEFSVADAKLAKLWNKAGPWTNYWPRMLKMRARAFALRDGFADVLRGLHIAEEVQDIPTGREARQKNAPPAPPAPPPAPEETDEAEIVEVSEVTEEVVSESAPPPPPAALARPAPIPAPDLLSPLDRVSPAVREMVENSPSAPPEIAQKAPTPPPPPERASASAREVPTQAATPVVSNAAPSPAPFAGMPPHLVALWEQFAGCTNETALENTWAFEEDEINGWPKAERERAEALYERRRAEFYRKGS